MRKLLAVLFAIASAAWAQEGPASYVTVSYMNGKGFILTTAPNTYTAGKAQTFVADATNPGLVLGGVTVDPSSSPVGGCWYRSDLGQVSCQGPSGVLRLLALGSGPLTITGPTSPGLPTAPATGNATLYFTPTFVAQTENPSGAVAGTQVVPRSACPAGQHVANIDSNGVQQCSADTSGFANPMTTVGDLIVGGTSGAATRVADVASGQCFVSGGVGVAPAWQACPGGGGGGGVNAQVGTSYTVVASDAGKLLTFSNAASIAVTLPQATTAGFTNGTIFNVFNAATGGTVTITPNLPSTINGATTLLLAPNQSASIYSDGTNYSILRSGTQALYIDQFGTVQVPNGAITSGSGVTASSGGNFNIVVDKNGTTHDFLVSAGWAGSAIVGDVVTIVAGTHTVADCAVSCTTPYGVVQQSAGNDVVLTIGSVTVNLDATYSPVGGWQACTSALTSGKITVQAAACPRGRRMGYVTAAGTSVTVATIVIDKDSTNVPDFPDTKFIPAAVCNNVAPGAGWSLPTSNAAAPFCRTGTNTNGGVLQFAAASTAQLSVPLPLDWDTAVAPNIRMYVSASTDATAGHTIIMQVASSCSKSDGSTTDDVAFNTAQALSTVTLNTTANATWTGTLTGITTTGCTAGGILRIQVTRATDTATGNVNVSGIQVTIPRILAIQAN